MGITKALSLIDKEKTMYTEHGKSHRRESRATGSQLQNDAYNLCRRYARKCNALRKKIIRYSERPYMFDVR